MWLLKTDYYWLSDTNIGLLHYLYYQLYIICYVSIAAFNGKLLVLYIKKFILILNIIIEL